MFKSNFRKMIIHFRNFKRVDQKKQSDNNNIFLKIIGTHLQYNKKTSKKTNINVNPKVSMRHSLHHTK